MKKKLALFTLLFALVCAGCQTMLENRLNDNIAKQFVSVGMTEAQVREKMGVPHEIELLPNGERKLSYALQIGNVKIGLMGKRTEEKPWSGRLDIFIGDSDFVKRYELTRSDEFGAEADLFRPANAANTNGDFKTALELLNKLIVSNQNYFIARELRASIYERLGNKTAAAEDYKYIVKTDPGNAIAHHNLAVLYYEQGDLDASIEAFSEALQSQPSYAVSQAYRARSFAKQGKLVLAKADVDAALQNGFIFDEKLKDELNKLGVQV